MGNMRNWVLGAAVVAGAAGVGVMTAQAAEYGFHMRGPVAYVPPCPGPGYVWIAGYTANGYWVPGYWTFRGAGPVARYDRGYERHFDRDRGWDRDRDRDHGYDRFRR